MTDELLGRLQSFAFDAPGAPLDFTRRLARENGWQLAHAVRAIDEYRRFVWLAMRAGHPVTPSPAVDEVWHLHLCYTRSYWDELCGRVLGRPLHHDPTRGGAAEGAKFVDWYTRTLASYRRHFGEPPRDLWPPPDERFRGGLARKVDAARHWIVRKPDWRRAAGVAAALLAIGVGSACSADAGDVLQLTAGGGIALVLVAMLVVAVRASSAPGERAAGAAGGGAARDADTRDEKEKEKEKKKDASSDGGCGGAGPIAHGCGHGRGGAHDANDGGSDGGGDGGGSGCGGGGGCGD